MFFIVDSVVNMRTKLFFFLALLLMNSLGVFAQSETSTSLQGDLNHDGKVDAADIVALADIIMKKDVGPSNNENGNPSSIAGWNIIGNPLSGLKLETTIKSNRTSSQKITNRLFFISRKSIFACRRCQKRSKRYFIKCKR